MSTNVAIVDDSDSSVNYAGSWSKAGGSEEFQSTTSTSATQGSTASLRFVGTSISVFGTLGPVNGPSDTSMSFVIDNSQSLSGSFTAPSNLSAAIHHNTFWQSPELSNEEHTLVVTMSQTQSNEIIFLDYFMYATTSTSVSAYFIDDRDARVTYNPSWTMQSSEQYFQDTAQQSTAKGDSFTLAFEGTAVEYYGDITDVNITAQMSVDGGPSTPFSIAALPSSALNVLLYSSGQLASGNHTLVVTAESSAPVWVDYFLVTPVTGSIASSSSSPPSSPLSSSSSSKTPSPSSQSQTTSKSKTLVGPIAGGVFGGLALVALTLFAFFCFRRRARRPRDREDIDPSPPAAFAPHSGAPIHAAYITDDAAFSTHGTVATSTSVLLPPTPALEEPSVYSSFDPYSTAAPRSLTSPTRTVLATENASVVHGGTNSDTVNSDAGSASLRPVHTGLSRKLAEEAARRAESAPRSPPIDPLPTYSA